MGSAELGLELGFGRNLIDDVRLGYLSGKTPDYIVVEETYQRSFDIYRMNEPQLYLHIHEALHGKSEVVYDHNYYKIYAVTK